MRFAGTARSGVALLLSAFSVVLAFFAGYTLLVVLAPPPHVYDAEYNLSALYLSIAAFVFAVLGVLLAWRRTTKVAQIAWILGAGAAVVAVCVFIVAGF